ncbi:MAG: transglycosylase SLT domain-containing protein [Acidobacteria bacterium]|nr:transglycosylase SLT domain-containing protein [Acidobacteriota bacterium]
MLERTTLQKLLIFSSVFLVFVAFSCSSTATSQFRPQQHQQLRAALDRDDARTAESLLREILSASPEAFAKNNYDYLLARLLMRRNANAEANQFLQPIVARNSPLAGYALWHQAEIARAAGNLKEEQRLLLKMLNQFGDHLWRDRAMTRLAESYFKSGQYQSVINLLKSSAPVRREHLALIGEAQEAARQTEAARATFESALNGKSEDDTAPRAALGLDRLDEAASALLSEETHLRRARIYQFNRYFAEARKHYLAIITQFSGSSARAEALFNLGRGYFWEDNFAEAAKWYEQVGKEFPATPEGEQGFYYVGHCHQYLGNTDRAIARYEEFLRAYPKSEYVGYAHLNAIDTLRTAKRNDEALKWAARGMAFSDPFTSVTAQFKQALIRLSQENYREALAEFTSLKTRNLNLRGLVATTNLPEVNFMYAYCLEKLGRYDEAINEYLAMPEVRVGASGYYGWRASERLRALGQNLRAKNLIAAQRDKFLSLARSANSQGNATAAKSAANQALRLSTNEVARNELLGILKNAYGKLRGYQAPAIAYTASGRTAPLGSNEAAASGTGHQTIANELLFLGLFDEGASELAETIASRPTIAYYCSRGECAKRSYDFGEPLLSALPDDYRLELLPRETAEVMYPMPYRDSLARHAKPRGVDPRFVLSIARQESSYNPRVKSYAAARGLMQFIAQTADQIADQLRLRDFEQNDLYNPDTAVLFGSQYMKNLFEEFRSPQAVAAAYNGSEDSVRRWMARAGTPELDRFVVEVLKSQTKEYVFKVSSYYLAYQKIYPNSSREQ